MTKSEMCYNMFQNELKGITSDTLVQRPVPRIVKEFRERCIKRFIKECNMTVAGATTYYSNMCNKFLGKMPTYIAKAVEHIPATHTPFEPTGVDPTTRGMYSVVRVVNGIADYVSCHHDRNDAIKESLSCKPPRPIVNGLQVVGVQVGLIEKG